LPFSSDIQVALKYIEERYNSEPSIRNKLDFSKAIADNAQTVVKSTMRDGTQLQSNSQNIQDGTLRFQADTTRTSDSSIS
jgi:hypothetical protein